MFWDSAPILGNSDGSVLVPWVPEEDDMLDQGPEQADPMADDVREQLGEMDLQGADSDPEMEGGLASLVGNMALRKRDSENN